MQHDADIEGPVDDSKVNSALVQNIEMNYETVEVKSHAVSETSTHVEDKVEASKDEIHSDTNVSMLPELIEVHAIAIFDQSPTHYLA